MYLAVLREHLIIKHTHTSLTSCGLPKKSIYRRTKAPQKDLRPWQKGVRRGESDSAGTMFVQAAFGKIFSKEARMGHTKIAPIDLDSPCCELSVCGLRFAVALLFRW